MRKIVMTHKLPDIGLNKLVDFNVVILDDKKTVRDQLMEEIIDADYLVSLLSVPIDDEILCKATRLKLIAQYAVGYNNIDISYAKDRGILVSNTPGVLTNATADLTWALLLALSRRILEGDKICRSGVQWEWLPEFLLGTGLAGKTIGVIGLGRIGLAVAKRAIGFNLNIFYYSRSRKEHIEKEHGLKYVELQALLSEADFVTVHVPYTPQTHHLIGESELAIMKKSSFLINTSRGKVIDETALIKALETKTVAGAALDVFYDEPFIPPALQKLPNVVL
ncbi:MAG: 2-hydroxyacid dehydrogenase, partial [Promethearchaeota archaeon]